MPDRLLGSVSDAPTPLLILPGAAEGEPNAEANVNVVRVSVVSARKVACLNSLDGIPVVNKLSALAGDSIPEVAPKADGPCCCAFPGCDEPFVVADSRARLCETALERRSRVPKIESNSCCSAEEA